jgi:hypothetical protein
LTSPVLCFVADRSKPQFVGDSAGIRPSNVPEADFWTVIASEWSLALIRNVSGRKRRGEAVALIAETFSIRRQGGSRWRCGGRAQLWDFNSVFLDNRTLKLCLRA